LAIWTEKVAGDLRMDAREFAKRVVTDDDFMLEVFKDMPDSAFTKDSKEEDFAAGLQAAAAKRGYDFEAADLQKGYVDAIQGLGPLNIFKFLRRFKKIAKKAGK